VRHVILERERGAAWTREHLPPAAAAQPAAS
jgi:hypothetical protein